MKYLALAAAIAVATALIVAAPPAEAGYISPDWSWQMKAFCYYSC